MKTTASLLLVVSGMVLHAQQPVPQDPIAGIPALFEKYRIVMLGEFHENRQEYDLLEKLIEDSRFTERVNDIVVEFGNARYQPVVDRYVAGENVPVDEVRKAWRDTVGAIGPVSPIYGEFYARIREVNRKLPRGRRLHIILGDPPIDWDRVKTIEDIALFLPFRDQYYASAVRTELLAKGHRALLIMGEAHFRRRGGKPGAIEQELLTALVKPYVILPVSDVIGGYDNIDSRFHQWTAPWLVEMKGSWIGSLPVQSGNGPASTWEQTADACLYLGARDSLTRIRPRRADLEGTTYGKEVERRLKIMFGKEVPDFLPASTEEPQYSRGPAAPPPLPRIPPPHP